MKHAAGARQTRRSHKLSFTLHVHVPGAHAASAPDPSSSVAVVLLERANHHLRQMIASFVM
jgi:hypothetical protein